MHTRNLAPRTKRRLARGVLLLLATVGLAVAAATASATAEVRHTGQTVTLQVRSVSGSDGDHFVTVTSERDDFTRPGELLTFDSVPLLFPGIFASDSGTRCDNDFVSNAVRCHFVVGTPIQVNMNLGDGADRIVVDRSSDFHPNGCDVIGTDALQMTVNLGAGVDTFDYPTTWSKREPQCIADSIFGVLVVNGGDGNDLIRSETSLSSGDGPEVGPATIDGGGGNDLVVGTLLGDTLRGSAGNDQIFGGQGNDAVLGGQGNDSLDGGPGNDTFEGGLGNDTITGDAGNDTFMPDDTIGIDGADSFSGDEGFDIANYGPRTVPLDISVGNGVADDGAADEHDNIVDADEVIGGGANDRIVGSSANETLLGNGGNDTLIGGPGDDVLRGGSDDGITGDFLSAVDGEADTVDCGPGLRDRASTDLKDTVIGCELAVRLPADESPPGHPLDKRVRLSNGHAAVRFACPKVAEPACHGELTLQAPGSSTVLGRSSYAFELGASATIKVALSRSEVKLLRRIGKVVVETTEQGHSEVGPRGARYVLPVA